MTAVATILALTPQLATARRLALVWGVHPVPFEEVHDVTEMVEHAGSAAVSHGFAGPGDVLVVIGGLLQNDNENVDANVPWLSDLPFVGWLFQQQRKNLKKSELVILMRPQVVAEDTWINEIQKSAAAFKELR